MPPPGENYDQWNVSKSIQEDVEYANHAILGKLGKDVKLESFRICW